MMHFQLMFAQSSLPQASGLWGFVVLVLLILFVTLVATDGSKDKDQ
jgi:hypothetical protein